MRSILALMALSFSLSINAKAESFLFLTHEQFLSLTSNEKKLYISEIRKLSVEFEDSMSSLSSTNAKWNFLFSRGVSEAQAKGENFNIVSMPNSNDVAYNPREEQARLGYAVTKIATHVKAYRTHQSQAQREQILEQTAKSIKRFHTLDINKLTPAQAKSFRKDFQELKNAYSEFVKMEPRYDTLSIPLYNVANSATFNKSYDNYSGPTKGDKPASPKTIQPAKAADSKVMSEKPLIVSGLKCIYAGFVIKKSKCEAPTSLPEGFQLKEINADQFKCKKDSGDVICNPLVFGYENSTTAYCIKRASDASANCEKISNNKDNLKRIHDMWSDPANRKAYEDYHADLKKICDTSTQTSADILKTCPIVIEKFNKIIRTEIPAMAQQSAAETKRLNSTIKIKKAQ